jgi:hypothetical protein
MRNIPVIEELHAIRQRLSQQQEHDVEKYAAMLREVARSLPGKYVSQPVLPITEPPQAGDIRHAG